MKYLKANILWLLAYNTGIFGGSVDKFIVRILISCISLGVFLVIYYCWTLKEDREKT